LELQEQVTKLTKELKQVKGSRQQGLCHKGFDVNPIDIAYS